MLVPTGSRLHDCRCKLYTAWSSISNQQELANLQELANSKPRPSFAWSCSCQTCHWHKHMLTRHHECQALLCLPTRVVLRGGAVPSCRIHMQSASSPSWHRSCPGGIIWGDRRAASRVLAPSGSWLQLTPQHTLSCLHQLAPQHASSSELKCRKQLMQADCR